MFLNALASLTSGVSESVGGAIKGWSDRSTIKAQTKAKVEEIRIESEVKIAEMEAEARKAKAKADREAEAAAKKAAAPKEEAPAATCNFDEYSYETVC